MPCGSGGRTVRRSCCSPEAPTASPLDVPAIGARLGTRGHSRRHPGRAAAGVREENRSMRQALTGWIIAAACFVLAGAAAVIGAERSRGGEVPAEVIASWRDYAEMVRRGKRTPLARDDAAPDRDGDRAERLCGVGDPAASRRGRGRGDRRTAPAAGSVALPVAFHSCTATGSSHIRWVMHPSARRAAGAGP